MRRFVIFILLISVFGISFSQEQSKNSTIQRGSRFGIYFDLGKCQPFYLDKSDVGYIGKESYSFEIHYLKSFSRHINFEIGLSFWSYKVYVNPIQLPGSPAPITESYNALSIPILYDLFSNHLYHFGIGTIVDFPLPHKTYINTDAQSGLGLVINLGKEFQIGKFAFDASPNLGIHSLVRFKSENVNHVMIQYGLKIGINYNLK
jgi:hypothetical protein